VDLWTWGPIGYGKTYPSQLSDHIFTGFLVHQRRARCQKCFVCNVWYLGHHDEVKYRLQWQWLWDSKYQCRWDIRKWSLTGRLIGDNGWHNGSQRVSSVSCDLHDNMIVDLIKLQLALDIHPRRIFHGYIGSFWFQISPRLSWQGNFMAEWGGMQ
jgi:hypothetical protein